MNTLSALILDSEVEMANFWGALLSGHGFKTIIATKPPTASESIDIDSFDLILTEYFFESPEFLSFLHTKGNPGNARRRITILLTYFQIDEQELNALLRENIIYIKKPLLPNDLISKIQRIF